MINVEKQTSVGGFESSTVVATISTHDYLPAVIWFLLFDFFMITCDLIFKILIL